MSEPELWNEFRGSINGMPISTYEVTTLKEEYDLLKEWGEIHRRHFVFKDERGGWCKVSSGMHPTAEAAAEEARSMALKCGYVKPEWWHWWRWGEALCPTPTQ